MTPNGSPQLRHPNRGLPYPLEVTWWLVKGVGLIVVLTLLPALAFGPPLWWLAAVNHTLMAPDVEHVQALFLATVLCVVWGAGWTALLMRKGVSR